MWKAFTILTGGDVCPGIEIIDGEIKLGLNGVFPIPQGDINVKKGESVERLVSANYVGDIALICIRQQYTCIDGCSVVPIAYRVKPYPGDGDGGGVTLMMEHLPPMGTRFPVECIYAVREGSTFYVQHLEDGLPCGKQLTYQYKDRELVLRHVDHIFNKG